MIPAVSRFSFHMYILSMPISWVPYQADSIDAKDKCIMSHSRSSGTVAAVKGSDCACERSGKTSRHLRPG